MHSLMEHFALEHNLGKVVELFAHMLENRMKPTTNTFRILITACQRAGQVELAFEVLGAMKARGLIPREVSHAPGWGRLPGHGTALHQGTALHYLQRTYRERRC
jgi:pentatricopeptide repeat protein